MMSLKRLLPDIDKVVVFGVEIKNNYAVKATVIFVNIFDGAKFYKQEKDMMKTRHKINYRRRAYIIYSITVHRY